MTYLAHLSLRTISSPLIPFKDGELSCSRHNLLHHRPDDMEIHFHDHRQGKEPIFGIKNRYGTQDLAPVQ